jgi:surface antigen
MQAYSKRKAAGLWRSACRLVAASCAVSMALGVGGCNTSYQLGDMFGTNSSPTATQSASAYAPVEARRARLEEPAQSDLSIAKAAATDLLARGGNDASQSWENPRTGARGTVTPIAATYVQNGATCRDFLASHVRGSHEAWYQGGACRQGAHWEVREFRRRS